MTRAVAETPAMAVVRLMRSHPDVGPHTMLLLRLADVDVVSLDLVYQRRERCHGHASRALAALSDLADAHGVSLDLLVSCPDTDPSRPGPGALAAWYGRNGFEAVGGTTEAPVMRCVPRDPEPGMAP